MTERPVLYLVVCAAGPAEHIDELVDLLIADGWRVCMIVSPTAAPWLDRSGVARQDRLSRYAWSGGCPATRSRTRRPMWCWPRRSRSTR